MGIHIQRTALFANALLGSLQDRRTKGIRLAAPYQGPSPQAQIPSGFLPQPTPYRLICIEVRALPWQIDQPWSQAGRPWIFPHRLASGLARCLRSPPTAQVASRSVASERPPMSQRCCYTPVPTTPPRRSANTPRNTSWPSRPTAGCPSLRQQPQSVPASPLSGLGRQNRPPVQVPGIHVPLFQKPVHPSHSRHQPRPYPAQINLVPPLIYPGPLHFSPWV